MFTRVLLFLVPVEQISLARPDRYDGQHSDDGLLANIPTYGSQTTGRNGTCFVA